MNRQQIRLSASRYGVLSGSTVHGFLPFFFVACVFLAALPCIGFAEETTRFKDCILGRDSDALSAEDPAPFEIASWLQLALTDNPTATLEHYALGLRLLESLRHPTPGVAITPNLDVLRYIIVCMCASADWRVKMTAAELAGELHDPQVAGTLATLVNDPEWPVRQRALLALGRIASDHSLQTLMAVLAITDEGHWFERECATLALGECSNTAGLLMALSDPSDEVRRMAVRQLARLQVFDAKTRETVDIARRREKKKGIKTDLKALLDRK